MNESSLDGKGSSRNGIEYWWCIAFTVFIGLFCFLCAVVMAFSPDSRITKIEEYNSAASKWNETYYPEMKDTSFTLHVQGESMIEMVNDTAVGEYYPYRDSCSKPGDPQCRDSPALFKYFSIPSHISSNPFIVLKSLKSPSHVIYNDTLPLVKNVTLTKEYLSCSAEGTACAKRCQSHGGTWNNVYKVCNIVSYLNRVCIRVRRDDDSANWMIDKPQLYDLGYNSDIGCEITIPNNTLLYETKTTWLPFYYSTEYVKTIPFILRHASDAYIRVEAITDGCASQSTTAANCFNKGKWDHRWTIISLFVYGVVSVIALIVFAILFFKGKISFDACAPISPMSIGVEMDGEKKDDTDPGQDAPIQKTASDSDIEQDPGELGPLIHTTFEGVSETAYEGVVEGI